MTNIPHTMESSQSLRRQQSRQKNLALIGILAAMAAMLATALQNQRRNPGQNHAPAAERAHDSRR